MTAPFPRRRALGTLLVAALVVTAGCSGPPDRLDASVKEVPSDIVLGSPESGAPVPAPVPPAVPVLTGPGVPPSLFDLGVPTGPSTTTPRTTPTTGPVRPACPTADPFSTPRRDAPNRVTEPPPAGPLPYRIDGTFSVSGANARQGRFPTSSTRTIANIRPTGSGFTYEVAAELAGTTTTTGYQVIRQSDVPGEAGIYVTFVATRAPSGATARFQPTLPIKFTEFPMVPNVSVTAAGTDPASATTVAWTTTVRQKARVDACGTPLDAITVQLTDGRATSPSTDVAFTATYAIATQFGGIAVADTVALQGREGLDDVSRRIVSTIDVEPGRAAR